MADVMVLQGIRQRYGGGDSPVVEVLHGIDLNLTEGGFSALVGPSGSGKSTLLHILGFLDRQSGGTYRFDGKHLDDHSSIFLFLRSVFLKYLLTFRGFVSVLLIKHKPFQI